MTDTLKDAIRISQNHDQIKITERNDHDLYNVRIGIINFLLSRYEINILLLNYKKWKIETEEQQCNSKEPNVDTAH